jgi:hypothetical protein
MFKTSLHTLLIFLFIGCGGASQHEPREEKTLYFIDLATNGLDYHCGERQGVTKSYTKNSVTTHGTLTCIYAPIKFYLGLLYLGEIKNVVHGQNIYPQSLVASFDGDFNNKEVLKRAILLQSLDSKISSDYISISQETKDKITLTSLDDLSIKQLNEAIIKMGFTPVSEEEAKIHLIMHSENTNIGKPIIKPFVEDISTSLVVGSTIGELSITKGDGTLHYPFRLQGKGAEHFLLNDKAKLILTQSLEYEAEFNLTVTATNEYGYSTQTLHIYVEEGGKIGKIPLEFLENSSEVMASASQNIGAKAPVPSFKKGATVKLFKLNTNGTKDFIASTTTNSRGSFDLMTEHLDDHEFYLYEFEDKLRLVTKGIWIKNAMYKIHITPLSEMLYTYVENLPIVKLEENLHKHAQLLLKKSLDENHNIDAKDIIIFNPIHNQNVLYPTLTYDNTYKKISDKIKTKEQSYKNDLFSAYVIDAFQSNAIEIIGSTVYTIDMMGSGEFRIYDLETKKLIGKLKLPNTPVEEDSHVIYVNLLVNDIRISSLTEWSYELSIHNQTKPIVNGSPFIKYSELSGSFNHITKGSNQSKYILAKEKEFYFYDKEKELKTTQQIKFFEMNKYNSIYQYEFDSQFFRIQSIWIHSNFLYIIGDNKINIFQEKNQKMEFTSSYNKLKVDGNILGVEENVLYILEKNTLTLLDITEPLKPKFIEKLTVPFTYKLGIKTNGAYITTGSKIIDIKALRASKNAK